MTSVDAFADDNQADIGAGLYLRRITGQETPILTNVQARTKQPGDRAGTWLRVAMGALAVLAATAAIVSYEAQFRLIYAYKAVKLIAALQAGIPDCAALVFAALGIALALHGKRAIRARLLNVAAVGTSIGMNALAASSGWKAMAVWTLAPVAYAVTSDTLIGVIRAYTIARQRELNEALADDEATPLAVLGKVFLYGARLVVAPPSTLSGMRRALLAATPLPTAENSAVESVTVPAVVELPTRGPVQAISSRPVAAIERPRRKSASRKDKAKTGGQSKTATFLDLVASEFGPLAELPLDRVSPICRDYAHQVGLHAGAARTALRKAVLAAQAGDAQ